MRKCIQVIVLYCISCSGIGFADENMPHGVHHKDWMLLVSPLAGWHENTLTSMVPGPGGMTEVSSTDTAPEYDVFAMLVHPRLVVNNTYFYSSKPNNADISGDFFFADLYARPENRLRWNLGAGYLWHDISLDNMDIEIAMPIVKLGLVAKCPFTGLHLNPYVGYVWEGVKTTYGDEDTESVLYGLTVKYYWRMLHVSLKYYLQDNLDTGRQYNVAKARVSFFFSEQLGVIASGEYAEHSQTEDSSFLLGPAFIF